MQSDMMLLRLRDPGINLNDPVPAAEGEIRRPSMEMLKQAILHQDSVFRLQVRELHRLYWNQKSLMAGLPSRSKLENSGLIDLQVPAGECRQGILGGVLEEKINIVKDPVAVEIDYEKASPSMVCGSIQQPFSNPSLRGIKQIGIAHANNLFPVQKKSTPHIHIDLNVTADIESFSVLDISSPRYHGPVICSVSNHGAPGELDTGGIYPLTSSSRVSSNGCSSKSNTSSRTRIDDTSLIERCTFTMERDNVQPIYDANPDKGNNDLVQKDNIFSFHGYQESNLKENFNPDRDINSVAEGEIQAMYTNEAADRKCSYVQDFTALGDCESRLFHLTSSKESKRIFVNSSSGSTHVVVTEPSKRSESANSEERKLDDEMAVYNAAELLTQISLQSVEYSKDPFVVASNVELDTFESMTLQLQECKDYNFASARRPEEDVKGKSTCRSLRQRLDFQRDILPGLVSLSRHEICEDLHRLRCAGGREGGANKESRIRSKR